MLKTCDIYREVYESQKKGDTAKTLRRLLSYMKDYKGQLIFVVVCILLSAIASAASALFLQSLIDDYIAPLLTSSAPVFTQLLNVLVVIGVIYLIGVLATLFYNRVMVTIAQGTLTYTKLEGRVVFDHVDFGYTPDKTVLHDISLYAEPGQKIAFVGATGAGKTTITNLINRFYDIDDGKIRYDGININKIRKADLRRSLGVVLQEVNLFTGTVMENLRYGNPDATDEECIAAAKLANADGFIRMLPQGYNTVLKGDGSGLSQGQRQLISIARAAVSDPPVMILDEATSSIDTRTEALVQGGMDKLMKGRTVFVIAHRLSTVQNSDVIMVLDHGYIIERGDHEKLIAEKGTYYQLYTGAFELE